MKMRRNIFRSFRFEIILYSLLSMIFTVLTEGGVIGIAYLIMQSLKNTPKNDLYSIENYANNQYLLPTMAIENENYKLRNELPANEFVIKFPGSLEKGAYLFVFLMIIAFILFIMYFFLFTKKFSTYLEEITKGIHQLSTGDFDTRIDVKNDDELTDIAMNLNKMAEDIKTLIENERKVETKKNDLITNVAHDLRTPLTSIIGYLDLVSNQNLDDITRNKYISVAYSKSKRLEQLINDLFTYTKLDFGEIKPVLEEVDLVKMMEQMIEEFYPSFQENNIEYQFLTKEKSIRMMADGGLLGRAFANLVGNAIRYGADGKDVIVKVEKDGDTAVTSIINFGEIIPKEELENIFNKFYRVDNSRNETTGGTGLGLTIARNIVKMHNGVIAVKSDLKGTVFEVRLPIISHEKCIK